MVDWQRQRLKAEVQPRYERHRITAALSCSCIAISRLLCLVFAFLLSFLRFCLDSLVFRLVP